MDCRCRFGSLGNTSTSSGSSEPQRDGRPEPQLGGRDIFFSCPLYSIFNALFIFFLYLSYFILAGPLRKCVGDSSRKFYISYSHNEWWLLFSCGYRNSWAGSFTRQKPFIIIVKLPPVQAVCSFTLNHLNLI